MEDLLRSILKELIEINKKINNTSTLTDEDKFTLRELLSKIGVE